MNHLASRLSRAGRHARAAGFTIIEVLGALAVTSLGLASFAYYANDAADDLRATATANYISEFNAGATRFVNAHYMDFLADGTSAIANSGQTVVNIKDLAGFLPANFATTSPLQQQPCLVLQRSGEELTAFAITRRPGTLRLDETHLTALAVMAGPNVGWIKRADNLASSVSGIWSLTADDMKKLNGASCADGQAWQPLDLITMLPLQGSGLLAGSVASAYLHRNKIAGHPELNQMNTDLGMNASINMLVPNTAINANAANTNLNMNGSASSIVMNGTDATIQMKGNSVQFGTSTTVIGSSCSKAIEDTTPVRADVNGDLIKCYGGTWKPIAVTEHCRFCVSVSGNESCSVMDGSGALNLQNVVFQGWDDCGGKNDSCYTPKMANLLTSVSTRMVCGP